MINVLIEEVTAGAEYESTIFDFWITGKLKSSKRIQIFDSKPFDLRNSIQENIECLIVAGFLELNKDSENQNEIQGRIVEKVNLLTQKKIPQNEITNKKWLGLETEDGVFLVSREEVQELNIKKEEKVCFNVGRFDLVGVV